MCNTLLTSDSYLSHKPNPRAITSAAMITTDCPADILLDPDFLVDFVGLDVVVVVVDTAALAVVFPPAGNIVVVVWPAAVVFCPDVGDIVVVCPSVDVIVVVVATVSTKIGVADDVTSTISQLLYQIDSPSVASLIPAMICISATRPKFSVPLSSGAHFPPPPFNPIKVFLQFNGQNVIVVLLNLKK